MDNVRFIPAVEARQMTEASDVMFNRIVAALMRDLKAAAQAGQYWVNYPEVENSEVRKRLNIMLGTHGYKIAEGRNWPGDMISWEPPPVDF